MGRPLHPRHTLYVCAVIQLYATLMTIQDLLKGKDAIEQLRILAAADASITAGRYYGGQLTELEISSLEKPRVGRKPITITEAMAEESEHY